MSKRCRRGSAVERTSLSLPRRPMDFCFLSRDLRGGPAAAPEFSAAADDKPTSSPASAAMTDTGVTTSRAGAVVPVTDAMAAPATATSSRLMAAAAASAAASAAGASSAAEERSTMARERTADAPTLRPAAPARGASARRETRQRAVASSHAALVDAARLGATAARSPRASPAPKRLVARRPVRTPPEGTPATPTAVAVARSALILASQSRRLRDWRGCDRSRRVPGVPGASGVRPPMTLF